jgi:hypothetical protein
MLCQCAKITPEIRGASFWLIVGQALYTNVESDSKRCSVVESGHGTMGFVHVPECFRRGGHKV